MPPKKEDMDPLDNKVNNLNAVGSSSHHHVASRQAHIVDLLEIAVLDKK